MLTKEELKSRIKKYRGLLDIATETLDDDTSVEVFKLFPLWESGNLYDVGAKVRYNDVLYKCIQEHTSQADWTPDQVPALFIAINESKAGTIDDPIPAVAGMLYVKDLYYIYNDVVYLCIRQDTEEGTMLYHTPDLLVGVYFEAI